MPASALKIIQISSDVGTWGSTGSPVKRLDGVIDGTLKIVEKVEAPPMSGYMGPGRIAAEVAQSGEGSFDFTPTYEHAPTILNGFFTAIGQSTITSGAPYTYPYTAPVSSTQAHATYTYEWGTSGTAYRTNGTVSKTLSLKGEAGGLWSGTLGVIAKEIMPETTGLSTAPVSTSVNPVRMADTTLYLDAFSTGTMGGTAISNTLISFDLSLETNRHLKTFAGSLKPADYGEGKWSSNLKLVCECGSTAKAIIDELLNTTGAMVSRQVRLKATNGSSASVKTFQVDFAGVMTEGETLFEDRDGNMTVSFNFDALYSTALANYLAFSIQNGSSSTT